MRSAVTWFALALLIAGCGFLSGTPRAWARKDGASKTKEKKEETAREQAEELRTLGAAALIERNLPSARQSLERSYERYPANETLYFFGLLAAAEGRSIEAQDLLRRFLREVGADVDAKQKKEADRILSTPIPAYGELDVLGEHRALLRVDGHLLGVLPLSQPLWLATGVHTVDLDRGSRRLSGPVEIRAGRTAELRFDIRTGVAVVTLPASVLLLDDYHLAPPATQTILARAVEQAIREEQQAILHAGPALLRAPELWTCLDTRSCQEQLMQRNEVDFALHVFLSAAPGYVIHGEILDAATGDLALALEEPIDPTQPAKLPSTVAALITRLLREGRSRPRGTLEVLSTPPGAEVELPRGVVGVTPYQHPAWAGIAEVTVRKAGYQPARGQVNIEAGKKGTVQVLLDPLPGPPPGRPRWRTITGAVAVGVGGTILLLSVSSLSLNRNAESVSGTAVAGAVFGGVLTIGGIVLLTLPSPRTQKSP